MGSTPFAPFWITQPPANVNLVTSETLLDVSKWNVSLITTVPLTSTAIKTRTNAVVSDSFMNLWVWK